MKNRVTPKNIQELEPNQVFVFGSNEAGRHGAGAAKQALKWGAVYGKAQGLQGQTYAIPTKNQTVQYALPVEAIEAYINAFIRVAIKNPDLIFLVTEIGCGLSGFKVSQIAPLFIECIKVKNIHLPESFWTVLRGLTEEVELVERLNFIEDTLDFWIQQCNTMSELMPDSSLQSDSMKGAYQNVKKLLTCNLYDDYAT